MNEKSYTESLPNNYQHRLSINFMKNKKLLIWINVSAFLILLPFASFYYIFLYKSFGLPASKDLWWAALVTIAAFAALIFLHELIHGIVFKIYSKSAGVKYGFNGLFAFAGNPSGYYFKNAYYMTAAMPAVCISLALIVVLFFVKGTAFFIIYALLATHFTGCLGDLYVCRQLSKLPNHTYIMDTGLDITVFVRRISKKNK